MQSRHMARLITAIPSSARLCPTPKFLQVRHAAIRKAPILFTSYKALEIQEAIASEFHLPKRKQKTTTASGKVEPGFAVRDVSGGTGQFVHITVVSPVFHGVPLAKRQDMVYKTISHLIDRYSVQIRCEAIVNKDNSGQALSASATQS